MTDLAFPRHILTPGPVMVPDAVAATFTWPPIHHRTARFSSLWRSVQDGLRYLCQTQYPVLLMPGTGTAGMELLLKNVLKSDDIVLVGVNGKFSARWEKYLAYSGFKVISCSVPWGTILTEELLFNAIATSRPTVAVLTHCETSTGQVMDLEQVAFKLKRAFPDILILADVNSTLGVAPFYMDAWGIDGISFASQKGLQCPAGLCGIVLSERLEERIVSAISDDAFGLLPYLTFCRKDSYPFTPPVQFLYALQVSLEMLKAESLPARWQAVHARAHRFRAYITQQEDHYRVPYIIHGDILTAFTPINSSCKELQEQLLERHGIEVAGGQDELQGTLLRVAHFGHENDAALDALMRAL